MMIDFAELRTKMVEEQLIGRGIKDQRVINAFKKVPREKFMLASNKHLAYEDGAQKIAADQTISQPYIVAYMLQALNLAPKDRVLDIGTGSGYAAAVLAEITSEVFTVEIIEKLALKAKTNFKKLNYDNIKVKISDGTLGWKEYAPYDAILVSAAAPYVPEKIVKDLKNKGRLIIPIGKRGGVQQLKLITKDYRGKVKTKNLEYVRFVPLLGEDSWR